MTIDDDNPAWKLVKMIFLVAIRERVSQIRITRTLPKVGVFFWVDGTWKNEMQPPGVLYRGILVVLIEISQCEEDQVAGRLRMDFAHNELYDIAWTTDGDEIALTLARVEAR
jgi:hypothetical protein